MTSEATTGTRHVTIRGARIRVRVEGDPAHPPVVLLHGIGRSLEDWGPQHERLASDHYVMSPDLPGFGLSEPVPGKLTLSTLADTVLAILDSLGERRPVHVVGNSLGGAVAMQMTSAVPDRIATLTLANSAGFGREVTVALRVVAVPFLGGFLLRRTDPEMIRRTERALFYDRVFLTEDRLAHAAEVARQPHRARVFHEIAQHLGTVRGIRDRWRAELLASVARHTRPTLVVWGDRDLVLPSRHLESVPRHLPHARSHLFSDTGHMPQIERSDEFAELVRDQVRSG